MLITPLGQRIVVRFARKPIWYPTAPSKLFRITNHTFYDNEEVKQVRRLRYAYRGQINSIVKFMEREFYIPATQAGGIPLDFIEKEKSEEEEILAENERINAEVAARKQQFFEERLKEMEEKIMEEKLVIEESLIDAGQKMDEYIKRIKAQPDSFVTPENIETLIDKAMENPIDFEYCIDKQGRRIGAKLDSQDRLKDQMP